MMYSWLHPTDVEMEWQEGFTELQSKGILHSNFISQVYDETNNCISDLFPDM